MKKDPYQILKFHMNSKDSDNLMSRHTKVLSRLAEHKYQTYEEYVSDCKGYGIFFFNEEWYINFMNNTWKEATQPETETARLYRTQLDSE